ncbi:MAG: HAD-IA family hydrolase [Chloroflexota bacterium]
MDRTPFDAIFFDLDGTLIDTESADFRACQLLYDELGLTISLEHWAATTVGVLDGYDLLFAELIQTSPNGLTAARLWQRIRELLEITNQNIGLMPGADTLPPQLHAAGYSLGIATASDRRWAGRWLNRFGLEPYFQVIATGDVVPRNKPAPDVYLFAAEQVGVCPGRCLVFEDSLPGVTAAKAAGMTVVAVPSPMTQSMDFSRADAAVPGLQHVTLDWIQTLARPAKSTF